MRRDQALAILRSHRAELARLGVKRIALFGSVARDEATANSDVDILIDLEPGAGLFRLMQVQRALEDVFHRKVDLVTRGSLHPALRERVQAEALEAA